MPVSVLMGVLRNAAHNPVWLMSVLRNASHDAGWLRRHAAATRIHRLVCCLCRLLTLRTAYTTILSYKNSSLETVISATSGCCRCILP